MPELPEVETIRQSLRRGGDFPALPGLRLVGGQVLWNRTLAVPDAETFSRQLEGRIVREVGRRGKFLILNLDHGNLLIHLRMSGDIVIEPQTESIGAYHRLVLDFDNGWRLGFSDPRKFGRVWLVTDPAVVVSRLGPEPLDESFTADKLYQMLCSRHRQLKPLLLDQTFLAGLGNIYTDEALHLARLHPLAVSSQVNQSAAERLWAAIRQVLEEGIRRNGASIDWVYRGGDFQNYFRAYQRTGQACPQCGTPIERIVVGQRGTHYCPHCQRM